MRSPQPAIVLELLNPISWFAAVWTFGRGVKSIEGDRRLGTRSPPVQLGVQAAVQLACIVMAAPQVIVIGFLLAWGHTIFAAIFAALLTIYALMPRLIQNPRKFTVSDNATWTTLCAFGLLESAFASRSTGQGLR